MVNIELEKYWSNDSEDNHYLKIFNMDIAVIQTGDNKAFCIYQYDTCWQEVYQDQLQTSIPEFDTLEEAKTVAELVFLRWFQATYHSIKNLL